MLTRTLDYKAKALPFAGARGEKAGFYLVFRGI